MRAPEDLWEMQALILEKGESIQCLTVQAEVFRSNWVVMIPARSGIWPLPDGTCCGQLELSEMDPGN